MQGALGQAFEFLKAVQNVAGLVLWLRGHVPQLPNEPVSDAEREDLHALAFEAPGHGPGVSTVAVAVGHQKDRPGCVGPGVKQDALQS